MAAKVRDGIRRRLVPLSDESGLGIVEVMVAAIVLILGVVGVFQAFEAASRNTYRAEQTQVALDRAQRELEKIRATDYGAIALTSQPGSSSNTNDPRYRVSGGNFALTKGNPPGTPPSSYSNLVVNGESLYGGGTITDGVVAPGPTHFESGDVSGDIFRYVVWQEQPGCSSCLGNQDFKRAIVVVRLDRVGIVDYDRPYFEVHSDFIDPADSVISDQAPGGGALVTAQQFWLTDTVCESDGSTARQDISGDHLLHNTRGTCANGQQTGSTLGAPDALMPAGPPDPEPDDPGQPLQYDYSSDAYLEPSPNTDEGLQLLRQDANGCSYTPAGATPEAKIHRWVTDPMASAFTMNAKASLYFFSRTINQAVQQGRLCVYLFIRSASDVDTLIANQSTGQSYFQFSPGGTGNWPQSFPNPANKLQMQFVAQTVQPGQRLGVAVSVDRAVTPASLEFMYDHPDYATRLEVDTTTPLS
ncbi:MAG: hypothetical protein AABM29_04210 [Actinomycetota bacterium]